MGKDKENSKFEDFKNELFGINLEPIYYQIPIPTFSYEMIDTNLKIDEKSFENTPKNEDKKSKIHKIKS